MVILEFGDYECPFCRRAERALDALRTKYPDQVAVVYRHYPLSQHRHAYKAARWAECGAEQGVFPAVHNVLYQVVSLSLTEARDIAELAPLPDTLRFLECAGETGKVPRIEADLATVEELGLFATPSIAVNGTLFGSAPDSVTLFALADSILGTSGQSP